LLFVPRRAPDFRYFAELENRARGETPLMGIEDGRTVRAEALRGGTVE
jgi:hypothetical protein